VASRLVSVTFAAHDPSRLGRFWAGLLGRDVVDDAHGVLVPGDDSQLGLRFVHSDGVRTAPNRMHMHLTSESLGQQQRTVAAALALEARHLDVGQRPE
jgi:hypothetical protein